ncbi:SDR family oxidoreductase [bacterium]|nr:SDR family oxidoreductase [bacterium]
MINDRFHSIAVGDEAEVFHTITEKDIDTFSELTGDDNPLHMDSEFAAGTSMRKRVAHGMLTASFISAIIGTRLPGRGALWYEQSLRFLAPVLVGDKIRVWAKVIEKSESQRVLVLSTMVTKGETGTKVIEGEARVKMLETKEPEKHEPTKGKGAVIVSGAGRGIGAAIALRLAAEGYPVAVNYCSSEREAEKVYSLIKQQGGRAITIKADISHRSEVDRMVETAVERLGPLEGVVNNAAPSIEPLDFTSLSWKHIQTHIDIQLKGAFNLCQAAIPHLLQRGQGSIVNISSIYADSNPPAKLVPYNLCKAALVSLTRSLAVELGPRGIRVNCVSPGMTETDFIANLPEKAKLLEKMQSPLRRLGTPPDIAEAVTFLISERACHITGENLRVCGGRVMG